MCRYGQTTYKPHLACFRCRKSFKRRLRADVDPHGDEHPPVCPECAGPLADMGLDFQPPRRHRTAAWHLLEQLHEVGITFHSCGCGGPGYRPRHPADLQRFLLSTRDTYRQHLAGWRDHPPTDERARALLHWADRLAQVEAALAAL